MSRKKVLIIDDDTGMQDVFQLIFSRAGYDTQVLSSAQPVLNGEISPPDIYIIDKQLAGVEGSDLCRFLKSHPATRSLPVILISASPTADRAAEQAGADAFVEKPFRRQELLAIVAKHLAARDKLIS